MSKQLTMWGAIWRLLVFCFMGVAVVVGVVTGVWMVMHLVFFTLHMLDGMASGVALWLLS